MQQHVEGAATKMILDEYAASREAGVVEQRMTAHLLVSGEKTALDALAGLDSTWAEGTALGHRDRAGKNLYVDLRCNRVKEWKENIKTLWLWESLMGWRGTRADLVQGGTAQGTSWLLTLPYTSTTGA